MRNRLILLLFAACLIGTLTSSAGGMHERSGASAKKRCKIVVKVIHGKKHRVRVCHPIKPKPKPKPKPPPPPPPPPPVDELRVDVGGYKLYIACAGSGSPTVVMEAGHNTTHEVWYKVQPEASRFTRVCAYDRAGGFSSDPRPDVPVGQPVPAERIVRELHALLHNGAIPGPYVLVGASIGGLYNRLYTKDYPDDVAGLVLVDGSPEQEFLNTDTHVLPGEPVDVWDAAQGLVGFGTGARPLVVLEQNRDDSESRSWQRTVAQRSSNSWWVIALASGHNIELPPPDGQPAIVIEAIRQVVTALRGSGTLPPCSSSPLSALGSRCLDPNAP